MTTETLVEREAAAGVLTMRASRSRLSRPDTRASESSKRSVAA